MIRPTRYEVSCLPEDDINAHAWTLTVEYRGRGLWAITDGHGCLGDNGEWDYENSPSNRDPMWIATHRFRLDDALDRARTALPAYTVKGMTCAEFLAGQGDSR